MTLELFRDNTYKKSYTSQITEIFQDRIIFDVTILYSNVGGQLQDIGKKL